MADDSDRYIEWIQESIQLGLDCLDVSTGEMLVLIQFKSGEKNSITVDVVAEDDPSGEKRRHLAHQMISGFDDGEFYSLLWSGTIATGDKSESVIAIEVGNRERAGSFITQPFTISEDGSLEKIGQPRIASQGSESVLALQEGIARSIKPATAKAPKKSKKIGQRFDPISTLGDLAERSIHFALQRMQQGNEAPFLALVDAETGRGRVTTARGPCGDFGIAVENLREQACECGDASMYAVVFFTMIEVDGKDVDAVMAETGDLHGSAPAYCLTFHVSKSLELTVGREIEIIYQTENLWTEGA